MYCKKSDIGIVNIGSQVFKKIHYIAVNNNHYVALAF